MSAEFILIVGRTAMDAVELARVYRLGTLAVLNGRQ